MKRKASILIPLILCLALLLAACGAAQAPENGDIAADANTAAAQTAETQTAQDSTAESESNETAAEDPHTDEAELPESLVGKWYDQTSQRASMDAELAFPEDSQYPVNYDIRISWGSSAWEATVWTMTVGYDAEQDAFVYENGRCADTVSTDDGTTTETELWSDGVGKFTLRDGLLFWEDSNTEEAAGMRFEKYVSPAVEPDQFADRFFRATAQIQPGTAGSSLQRAQAAFEIVRFAADGSFCYCDIPTMRDHMLTAWESLTDAEREQFDSAFYGDELWQLINSAFADYESVRGQFEDAGAGDIALYLADKDVQDSWNTLLTHSFTMGNSDA